MFGRLKKLQKVGSEYEHSKAERPWELDLSNVPYIPLPPSPNAWERKEPEPASADNDFFEIHDLAGQITKDCHKLEMPQRPDPAFRYFAPTKNGCLFIDKSGKGTKSDQAKASLMLRDPTGVIRSHVDLEHDIYRIGSTLAGAHTIFLSSESILHGYDEEFHPFLEIDLKQDTRIRMMNTPDLFGDEPIRRRIRNVSVSPDGERIIVTAVDTAWCLDKNGKTIWAVSMPLGEGWERVLSRTNSVGNREEIDAALSLMQLQLPVNQDVIKERYRKIALAWHPDLNPSDPDSTIRMQKLNHAFDILTGVNPKSLEISDHATLHFRRTKPDMEIDMGGYTIAISLGGPTLDWIYAASYAFDNKHVYLGSYEGKIVKLSETGKPVAVLDVGNVPRGIDDVGRYLFLRTGSRVYILSQDLSLVEVIDIYRKSKFIVTPRGFGEMAKNNLRWYSSDGRLCGEIRSKHPLRAAYFSNDQLNVETRQHIIGITLQGVLERDSHL